MVFPNWQKLSQDSLNINSYFLCLFVVSIKNINNKINYFTSLKVLRTSAKDHLGTKMRVYLMLIWEDCLKNVPFRMQMQLTFTLN